MDSKIYEDGLQKVAISVIERCVRTGTITDNDLIFFNLFQKELKKANKEPLIDKFLNGAKTLSSFFNENLEETKQDDINDDGSEII